MVFPRLLSASAGPNLDAQSLHSCLVSCTDDIIGACRAVEAFLQEQPPESALGFFRVCFPVLLQKVFGFQDSGLSSSSAWLVRATDEHTANALRSILHPTGPLFTSLVALDREQAVQFVFPTERLPLRIRRLLLLDRGVSLLSQASELFKNRIKVLGTLAGSKDLLDFLRKVDHTHHTVFTKIEHGQTFFVDMDWEESISSSETQLGDWFSCHAPQEKVQSRLFGASAFHAFQMLILQCEAEMQFVPSESQKTIYKALEYVKRAGVEIFTLNSPNSLVTSKAETYSKPSMQNEVRALGRHTCFDVKYRGDWMRRPIESTEVAFLARLLVKLSDTINYKLNLTWDIDHHQEQRTPWQKTSHSSGGLANATELDMAGLLRASRNSVVNLSFMGLLEETRAFLLSCWNACCVWLQQRCWRVNLRFLAQKPLVVLLLMVLTVTLLKKF